MLLPIPPLPCFISFCFFILNCFLLNYCVLLDLKWWVFFNHNFLCMDLEVMHSFYFLNDFPRTYIYDSFIMNNELRVRDKSTTSSIKSKFYIDLIMYICPSYSHLYISSVHVRSSFYTVPYAQRIHFLIFYLHWNQLTI